MPNGMAGKSLRERAYDHIRGKVLSGELAPGQQVSEISLAQEIGSSRTPVREAINRLQNEGLLLQIPRYGTVVRRPERQDIEELYELREGLESHAVALAALRASPRDVEILEGILGEMRNVAAEFRRSGRRFLEGAPLKRFLAADMSFHIALLRAAGNRRIMEVLSNSHILSRINTMPRTAFDEERLRRAEHFHARILAAVKKKDAEAARRETAAHIRASREEALEGFDRVRAGASVAVFPEGLAEELQQIESRIE